MKTAGSLLVTTVQTVAYSYNLTNDQADVIVQVQHTIIKSPPIPMRE